MSRSFLIGLAVMATCLSSQASAAVYKCTDKSGNMTFSGQPCAKDAEVVNVQTHTPTAEEVAKAQTELDQVSDELSNSRRERAIKDLEKTISVKQRKMEQELEVIRYKQSTANNNIAGAQYYAGLATEMQAVTARYQGEIDSLRSQINALKSEK